MRDDRSTSTSSSAFFEAKYREDPDPWDFSNSAYEQLRYTAIISAIDHQRYRRAFEPGCSIGVLTELLARHCDQVDAIDFSPTAAANASARCAHLPNVKVRCGSLKDPIPMHTFDLIVFSEIGYYFNPKDWQEISAAIVAAVPAGAVVLAAHWLGHSKDHCISGDQVHEILRSNPLLRVEHEERNPSFRLDRLVRL